MSKKEEMKEQGSAKEKSEEKKKSNAKRRGMIKRTRNWEYKKKEVKHEIKC